MQRTVNGRDKRNPMRNRKHDPEERPSHPAVPKNKIYILPTRHGILLLGVLLLMLVGSINYNNNLGFFFTFFIGSMAVVSTFHTHRNLSGLMIRSIRANPVFKGQLAVFRITLHAGSFSRRALLLSFEGAAPMPADFPAGAKASIGISLPSLTRGMLTPGPLTIRTSYPLGLFSGWTKVNLPAGCLIYPRPLSGPPATGAGGAGNKGAQRASSRGNDEFTELSPYRPGDPLSHISWKVFSKGQGLFTKVFAGERGTSPIFDMDLLGGMETEEKLSRLTHMVLTAQKRNLEYGIRLSGRLIGPGKGRAHDLECLGKLSMFGNPGQSTGSGSKKGSVSSGAEVK